MKTISIIMPAYQAEKTLPTVFRRIPTHTMERISHIFAVDDGSTDGTWDTLRQLTTQYAKLKPLRHPQNRGYGGALKTLIAAALEADSEAVVVLHADGQYAPESMSDLIAPLESGIAVITQGSRMLGGGALKGGMPLYKYIANRSLTFIENRAFGLRLHEYHSGYMAYTRGFLEAIPWKDLSDSFDFDLELIALACGHKLPLQEVPIPTHYGDEVSHLKSIPYGLRVLKVVWRYLRGHYRPPKPQ